jgi:hypothetical protein
VFNIDCVCYMIVKHGSFISLFILLVKMLIECNGFDFESIESSLFLYLDMAFSS